jgi:hypothetical protein
MNVVQNAEGRLDVELEYAQRKYPFALIEEMWAENHPQLAVYEGTNAYFRQNQFGGDPSFRDCWCPPSKPGEYDIHREADIVMETLVKMAIQTEIDLATLGGNSLILDRIEADPSKYEVELYEFVRNLAPIDIAEALPFGAENFLTKIGLNAAKRVASALATIY